MITKGSNQTVSLALPCEILHLGFSYFARPSPTMIKPIDLSKRHLS